jgi:hypothetical protein
VPVPVPVSPPSLSSPPAPARLSPVVPPVPLAVHSVQWLTVPIHSLALGTAARVAALGDEPYLGDAHGFHPLPLPPALHSKPGDTDDWRIFFGRDNEPRIMGKRRSSAGESAVYYRHTSAGWRDGREEIGQLGGTTHGGLWGVLGAVDPELVCRANAQCIIKRTSGWATAPAGPAPRSVELWGGTLWGLDASGLANVDAHGWAVVLPAPQHAWAQAPRAFWATSGQAWVAESGELFHFAGGDWSREPAPIADPAAFWAADAGSVWVVGRGGAAHFDGHGWRLLAIAGPLSAIAARADDELWFGGDAGLFQVHP